MRAGGGHLYRVRPGQDAVRLIRKTVKGVTVLNVQDEETLKAAVEAVKARG